MVPRDLLSAFQLDRSGYNLNLGGGTVVAFKNDTDINGTIPGALRHTTQRGYQYVCDVQVRRIHEPTYSRIMTWKEGSSNPLYAECLGVLTDLTL